MKLLSLLFSLVLLNPAVSLYAQDDNSDENAAPAAGAGGGGHRLAFLSMEDRRHYMKVRREVLQSNPDLKSEQESLQKEMQFVHGKGADASAQDRETLRNNFLAHHEKMDAAMKAADPTVAPIIDQVNEHFKAMMEKRAGGAGDAGGNAGGNPEPGA